MLRQPSTVSKAEKEEYVEQVISMLGMEDFAEAVVGVPGEGLNVEQRKLLTIGVELAARPKLLLFCMPALKSSQATQMLTDISGRTNQRP
jgi:ATP-binding cassette, subfamily G (WHITE), member 2, PDR